MKKIRIDFIIIAALILAAPVAYVIKNVKNYEDLTEKNHYSVHISMKSTLNNLNESNFTEHYETVKKAIDGGEKMGNFASCIVFNKYKDDLIFYRKELFTDLSLARKSMEKTNLLNWCMSSYKYMDDKIDNQFRSAYYKTVGYNFLYGFKGEQDIDKANSFFNMATNTSNNPESIRASSIIQKYKNMYPGLKNEYLLIYIDNELNK